MRAKKFNLPDIGNRNSERTRRVREVARLFFNAEEKRVESEERNLEEAAQTIVHSYDKDEWLPREKSKADNPE
jgi:hypothetical protein